MPMHSESYQRTALTRIRNFLSRPTSDQVLVLQATILLGLTRFAICTFSWKRLQKLLGQRHDETAKDISADEYELARKVYWAVHTVSPYTPWKSNCFPQALTAKILLRRRGIESTLYLGAAFKQDSSDLGGHAWLRCGQFFVTGGDSSDEFGAIVAFGK